jgi:predicted nucleic acid-binding protein
VIVIESSAVVDALVDNPANPELLALMADNDLHAPALLDYEVASALRGHALSGKLTDTQLDDAAEDLNALRIQRYRLSTMVPDVLRLRDNFTMYDAVYVVLGAGSRPSPHHRRRHADRSPSARCQRPRSSPAGWLILYGAAFC